MRRKPDGVDRLVTGIGRIFDELERSVEKHSGNGGFTEIDVCTGERIKVPANRRTVAKRFYFTKRLAAAKAAAKKLFDAATDSVIHSKLDAGSSAMLCEKMIALSEATGQLTSSLDDDDKVNIEWSRISRFLVDAFNSRDRLSEILAKIGKPNPTQTCQTVYGWTKQHLAKVGGIGTTTFDEIRRVAKLPPPKHGQRGFRFSREDVKRLNCAAASKPARSKWIDAAKRWGDMLGGSGEIP